jgi:prepilin-type N-terminal cleavage/methylation domain-containing protein/prepilin-type processing-associated H-X9-DG protein
MDKSNLARPVSTGGRSPNCSRGFTLVELLVVIGIIAILISIVLPAMGGARRTANTLACESNMRQILVAMTQYVAQNNNYIPGGASTSAAFLTTTAGTTVGYGKDGNGVKYSDTNCPSIVQTWDWVSPLAKVMGYSFPDGADVGSRCTRFHQLWEIRVFQCPQNQFIASEYSNDNFLAGLPPGPAIPPATVGTGWKIRNELMMSYFIPMDFLLQPNKVNGKNVSGLSEVKYVNPNYTITPSNYVPKLTKIGNASRKAFIADGGKYTNTAIVGAGSQEPDYVASMDPGGTQGGAYADYGPWDGYSRALLRTFARGNQSAPPGTLDPRVFGFRHGIQSGLGPTDAYRFNVGFFDGHVETLGDLEGSDPSFWSPTGTQINTGEFLQQNDTVAKYIGKLPAGTQYWTCK